MAEKEWAEEKVRVGGTELAIIKGGKGKPLLLLHGELGWPGWTPWNSALAKERTVTARVYLTRGAADPQKPDFTKLFGGEQTPEQYEAWEEARAETARLAWAPYMFNPSLPHLLEGVDGLPTMLLWGKQDPVVPLSA